MTVQEIMNILNYDRSSEIFTFCTELEELMDRNNFEEAISRLQIRFNCDQETASNVFKEYKTQIYDEIVKDRNENQLSPEQIAYNNAVARELLNKPKCPTCQSINVQKIGTGERMASVAVFGIFSKKINKSYKCKNCGYTW